MNQYQFLFSRHHHMKYIPLISWNPEIFPKTLLLAIFGRYAGRLASTGTSTIIYRLEMLDLEFSGASQRSRPLLLLGMCIGQTIKHNEGNSSAKWQNKRRLILLILYKKQVSGFNLVLRFGTFNLFASLGNFQFLLEGRGGKQGDLTNLYKLPKPHERESLRGGLLTCPRLEELKVEKPPAQKETQTRQHCELFPHSRKCMLALRNNYYIRAF